MSSYYDPEWTPTYRIGAGRPPRGANRKIPTHLRTTAIPDYLWDVIQEDCAVPEVARALSDHQGGERDPARSADYIRAALLVFHLLIAGELDNTDAVAPNRDRILALLSLPDRRMREVVTQIEFRFAALPDPHPPVGLVTGAVLENVDDPNVVNEELHREIYLQNTGAIPVREGSAPMEDSHPWMPVLPDI